MVMGEGTFVFAVTDQALHLDLTGEDLHSVVVTGNKPGLITVGHMILFGGAIIHPHITKRFYATLRETKSPSPSAPMLFQLR
jgi:hypothetical protein